MKIIIDERVREKEYLYLKDELKLDVIKLPISNTVYQEISGHSDIFYTMINNQIICAPNAKIIEPQFIIGSEEVGESYPEDIKYNVCQIGKFVIGSKYADKILKDKINIYVKQGYTKCSICVTGDNSAITTDIGIYKTLIEKDIDVTLINEKNIKLLNKDGSFSNMYGFIGGATAVIYNIFILFGDIKFLNIDTQNKIQNHIKKYNLQFKDFKDMEVIDYGGIVMYN